MPKVHKKGGKKFIQSYKAEFTPTPGLYSLPDGRTLEVMDNGTYRTHTSAVGWKTILPAEQPMDHIDLTEQLKELKPGITYPTARQTRRTAAREALKKHGYPDEADTAAAEEE